MNTADLRLLDTEYPDELHCVPNDDLIEHDYSGACWCAPAQEVQRFEDGYFRFLWYHHAADCRDYYGAEELPLQ